MARTPTVRIFEPVNAAAAPAELRTFSARDGIQAHAVLASTNEATQWEFELDGTSRFLASLPFFELDGLSGTATYSIRCRGRDASGAYSAWTAAQEVFISPSLPPLLAFTPTETVNYTAKDGKVVAWLKFDVPVPVAYCAEGRPLILTDRPFRIIEDFPPSGPISGVVRHGMMINPKMSDNGNRQGFDQRLETMGGSTATTYDAALNDSPTLSGNGPIGVAAGDQFVAIKIVSRRGASGLQPIQWACEFSFIGTKYAEDVIRPPIADPARIPWIFERGLDMRAWRDLTAPANTYTYKSAFDNLPMNLFEYAVAVGSAESSNGLVPYEFGEVGNVNYAGDNVGGRIRSEYVLHSSALTPGQKLTLATRKALHGIDIAAAYIHNNFRGGGADGGAGQQHGRHGPIWQAYFMTGDPRLLEAAKGHSSTVMRDPQTNIFWITETKTNETTGLIDGTRRAIYPYPPESVDAVCADQDGNGIPPLAGYNVYG